MAGLRLYDSYLSQGTFAMSNSASMDRFSALAVGQVAERSRVVTDHDIRQFAHATGDENPVHLDEDVGRRSIFGSRIAHGMLSAGFISAALASDLPGPGSVYISQSLRFKRPVRIGDRITTRVEVREIDDSRRRVTLSTTCRNQSGDIVVDGEGVVMVPEMA